MTGELRVLLDTKSDRMTLSPYGTLAFALSVDPQALSVYDLLTGSLLFKLNDVLRHAACHKTTSCSS